jgi:hypothetical protein
MSTKPAGGRLSDDEAQALVALLHRFCEYELDQFALWRLSTSYGTVFTTIARRPPEGVAPDSYIELDLPGARDKD